METTTTTESLPIALVTENGDDLTYELVELPAITLGQWHLGRDPEDDTEIVRFHQPHPAFLVA